MPVVLTTVSQHSIFSKTRTDTRAMSRLFSLFLDRLAERFAVLLAGSLSSRVEGLHATLQADQQSQLEDLARKYEADGKTDIAAALRQRASRLTSTDLAAEAVEVVEQVTADATRPPLASQGGLLPGHALPDFNAAPASGNRRRRKTTIEDTTTSLQTETEQ
jgi:hypothetical protein